MTNHDEQIITSIDSSNHNHDVDNSKRRLTKNEKRRLREKTKILSESNGLTHIKDDTNNNNNDNIVIEYISPNINFDQEFVGNNSLDEFKSIFQKFLKPEELLSTTNLVTSTNNNNNNSNDSVVTNSNHTSDSNNKTTALSTSNSDSNNPNEKKVSKKKLKLASRLSVAELKQLVPRPDVVEAHDVTSSDPRLLVYLKAMRNTVTVPRHWSAKSKYLQRKRGIEKPPFQLPEFIAETGIAKIRESVIEQETLKRSKQKAREKMQPKMGKIDIDYQVLHDAFFKYQTKPKVTIHGDLYYEGKEFEVQVKDSKPGIISPQLKEALGMTENSPPPYLINMQRYGPPPSYPSLKIPGLNAPIPPGASFGYQVGGWGKPPVDEYGRPIYGDVFGTTKQIDDSYIDVNIDKKTRWGEITATEKEDENEEDNDDDEEDEDNEEDEDQPSGKRLKTTDGIETPMTLDGMNSISTGLETSTVIDLRKRSGLDTPNSMYTEIQPKDLYKVIPQKAITQADGQLFTSNRAYAITDESTDVKDVDPQANHENDGQNGKKKRRLDSSVSVQKLKDFKF